MTGPKIPPAATHDLVSKTPCRGCGKPIFFAADLNGKMIPLDPTPPVYRWEIGPAGEAFCERVPQAAVSHFATCPHAALFSSHKPRKPKEGA